MESIDGIEASGLPIRYVIVDMGHTSNRGGGLDTFAPHAEKFPNGWAPLLERRKDDQIKWMGLWHFFQGAQSGISPNNDFGPELNKHFMTVRNRKTLTPKNNPGSARAFYRAYMESVTQYGFDFVKVDFQSAQLGQLAGNVENAAQMCVYNAQAFEEALHGLGLGLINCNWHNSVNFFNCRYSNVGRCSMDYVAHNLFSARRHLYQSYANIPWLGQLAWGDHDMFHSSDRIAGRVMAVSKAMSGGPVYLSDAPDNFDAQVIMPLCLEDGRLLRPMAPAAPLPESVFHEPFRNPVPYRVIAPLQGNAAAVVVYNLRHAREPVSVRAKLSPKDYRHASGMMQPYPGPWEMPAEGVILYDGYAGKGWLFETEYEFELHGLEDRLFQLSPVAEGWSAIGRTDKFLPAAAVEVLSASKGEMRIKMLEAGPFAIWSAQGPPTAAGVEFADAGNGLYTADLPVGERGKTMIITR